MLYGVTYEAPQTHRAQCHYDSLVVRIMKELYLVVVVVWECAVAAKHRKAAPPVVVTWPGDTSGCEGVAITRHHVLAYHACLPVQGDSYKVEIRAGKGHRRSATPLQGSKAVTVLSLDKPLPSGGGLIVDRLHSGPVRLALGQVDLPCHLHNNLQLECSDPPVGTGWPVYQSNGNLLGFSTHNLKLEPIFDEMSIIGGLIAADFVKRFSNGEKRMFKCKRTETLALEFLLVIMFCIAASLDNIQSDKMCFTEELQLWPR